MDRKTSAGRHGTPDDATGAAARLRRLLRRSEDPDRSSRRAGRDPFPAAMLTPRVWVALG